MGNIKKQSNVLPTHFKDFFFRTLGRFAQHMIGERGVSERYLKLRIDKNHFMGD